MKPSSLVVVALFATGVAACQRQAAPERSASAQPAPSPLAASAALLSTPTGDRLPGAPPEAAPAPGARPARRSASERPPVATDTRLPAPPPRAPERAAQASAQPRPEPLVLPAGTELPIRLDETLASDKSRAEDSVAAELTEDVRVNGRVALPAGTQILGHVVVAQQSGRVKGRARLVVAFEEIRLGKRSYPIEAMRWDVTAESSGSRDAKIAGGAAAAGVLIGALTGGGKGALKGGLIGGAAGGAAVLVTRGKEVELPSGARHKVTLRQALRIE